MSDINERAKLFRAHLRDLTDAITALEEGIGGKSTTPLEKAQASQRIADARKFQSALGDRVRELDGSKERLLREMRQRMPAW